MGKRGRHYIKNQEKTKQKTSKVEQEAKRLRTQWKNLPAGKEREIIGRYESGMPRSSIKRIYGIPEGQLYSIIRKTATR